MQSNPSELQSPIKFPPPLKPRDRVTVVSPSGRLRELEAFERGLEIWKSRGYHVELGSHWNACEGYLAGTDAQRNEALIQAWNDPNSQGILCARGGYGTTRLLESWTSHSPFTQSSKWIVGFSDITGLLWYLATLGISGIHGPLLTTLDREPEWSQQRLFDCIEGRPLAPLKGKGWGGGIARGILLPANLTVATYLLGTPAQPPLKGVILALEDVGEAPYRIDRMLTYWRALGAFQGIAGIALGRFSFCRGTPGHSSWTAQEVLRDRVGDLGIPVVGGLPFGHDGVNAALPVGQLAQLDGDRGILEMIYP